MNLTVRKNYEIVPIGLAFYDQEAEGTTVDLDVVSLYIRFSIHNDHLDRQLNIEFLKLFCNSVLDRAASFFLINLNFSLSILS